jgi:hypothetical protein
MDGFDRFASIETPKRGIGCIMKFDVTRRMITAAVAVAIVSLGAAAHSVPASTPAGKGSVKAKASVALVPAPNFTLTDADGVKRSLTDYRGRPVALYFFCGCDWCHDVAGKWSMMQRAGALSTAADDKNGPVTLVVFQGDADAVKTFARETALDLDHTVLMTDPDVSVTVDKYHAEPCPRVFVLDTAGNVVYTNNHKDDEARVAKGIVIASRALDAIRKVGAAAPKKSAAG